MGHKPDYFEYFERLGYFYWLSIPPITRAPRDHDSLVPSTSQHAYDEQPVKTTPKLTNKSNAH